MSKMSAVNFHKYCKTTLKLLKALKFKVYYIYSNCDLFLQLWGIILKLF